MGSTPLTLAALATSAVADLLVSGARRHTLNGDGAFTSGVVASDRGELIVRVPRSTQAESLQAAEVLGLSALTPGARAALPVELPETLGQTRAGNTRAVVSTFLPGSFFTAEDLAEDALLLQPIAETLAAIHSLPQSLIRDAGLRVASAAETRAEVARLVDRAIATRLVPSTVAERWQLMLESAELWRFEPVVVHGTMAAERFLVQSDRVTGVLGWSGLAIGDPAEDFAWLSACGEDVLEGVLARYAAKRGLGDRDRLRARALFLHELEVARWLLHGVERRDQEIIDDAVTMLDRLVDRLSYLPQPLARRESLNVSQVSDLLDESDRAAQAAPRRDESPYPADEQLLFPETDLIEPLPDDLLPNADRTSSFADDTFGTPPER